MSLNIPVATDRRIGLDEFSELFREGKFDAGDPASLAEAAELLASLSNNKSFLSDLILAELRNGLEGQRENFYGPHVIKLPSPTEYTVMRANIWPSETDEDYRRSPRSFIYGVPHDHNLNFLTVGYWGPGYRSRYYEYDYASVEGYAGESVDVREVCEKALEPDTVMLYRAHRDIHAQFAPDSLSISINVMDSSPKHLFKDQYIFDVDGGHVTSVLSSRCSPHLFEVAAAFGDSEIQEALVSISRHHDSDYTRTCAYRSALRAERDERQIEALVADGTMSGVGGIRAIASQHRSV